MSEITEHFKTMCEALKDERKRIAEEMYSYQKTVSQFATADECKAYNQALRDFAEKLLGA